MKVIGISGLARSGKDSFYLMSKELLPRLGHSQKIRRLAFADELKNECDEFLSKNTGISAFTEINSEKEIIRPFLVTYGTHIRRKLNKRCWIDKVESKLGSKNEDIVFITDVRYKNEIDWVHSLGGHTVHIQRAGIVPPNEEEKLNDPILKKNSKHELHWDDFSEGNIEIATSQIKRILNKIINNEESK